MDRKRRKVFRLDEYIFFSFFFFFMYFLLFLRNASTNRDDFFCILYSMLSLIRIFLRLFLVIYFFTKILFLRMFMDYSGLDRVMGMKLFAFYRDSSPTGSVSKFLFIVNYCYSKECVVYQFHLRLVIIAALNMFNK
jgi:hypothetical protein